MKHLYRVVSLPNPLPPGYTQTLPMPLKMAIQLADTLSTVGDGKISAMVVVEEEAS